jgi:ubiquinone/menaquinone biosynthesis C-methylase UbiE
MSDLALSFDDSAAYEGFMGRWSRAAGALFLEWMAPPANARWLDVGCGTGILAELILDACSPAAVSAVDPARAQIDHALRQPVAQRAHFRVADAQALPFETATFDIVVSGLVMNFIPDRHRAAAEMRRVARAGGIVAGYVWDFAAELSPSWPLRRAMRQVRADVPPVPGTEQSKLSALQSLFEKAGLEKIAVTPIQVTESFLDFDDFWTAQTSVYGPISSVFSGMREAERGRLMQAARDVLPACPDGRIKYSVRANAIKARVPD